jgi:glycerol-3-phosphate responsive antiterminator
VQQIFIPVAITEEMQPLDVGLNRPFKVYYREGYHRWQQENSDVTKKGRQVFIDLVSKAWEKVSMEYVKKSFVGAGIVSEKNLAVEAGSDNNAENSFLEISFAFEDEHSFAENDSVEEILL